jgi:hypothetical protein
MHSRERRSLHAARIFGLELRLCTLNLIYSRTSRDYVAGRGNALWVGRITRPFCCIPTQSDEVRLILYTSCTLTLLAPRSTIVMRKLRIWPVRTGSALDSLAEGPFFHRDASMALNDDRSNAPA